MYNRKNLADAAFRMASKGGYIFSFVRQVRIDIPDMTWVELRNVILGNGYGNFCGYGEQAVINAFSGR